MNTSILPKGSRLINGIQYLAAYIAIDGAYVIARKQAEAGGSNFDYYSVKDTPTFKAVWPTLAASLPYTDTIETGANLAVLFNQVFDLATNSLPTKVQMVGLPNPLPVVVTNPGGATVAGEPVAPYGLTDGQLRASKVPVAVDFPSTAPLPTGASTEATLASALVALQAVLAQLKTTLSVSASGQVSVSNFPPGFQVMVANQLLPIAGEVIVNNLPNKYWQDTQPVSLASAPLPAGAATASGQVDATAQLTAINTKLGGALTFNIPAGAATTTNQLIGNTSLNSIDAKLTSQATAALQTTANGYLQTLASQGFTATVTSAAITPYSFVAATGNNATLVKSGATQVAGLTVTNAASSYRYAMFYNSATAPTTGATPLITVAVPPNQSVTFPIPSSKYISFSLGLSFAVGTATNLGTLVAGLVGTTGVAASDMIINLVYS